MYHTYSAYKCGVDGLWGMCQWLDRAPLGRNEPGTHAPFTMRWIRRHDEYGRDQAATTMSAKELS